MSIPRLQPVWLQKSRLESQWRPSTHGVKRRCEALTIELSAVCDDVLLKIQSSPSLPPFAAEGERPAGSLIAEALDEYTQAAACMAAEIPAGEPMETFDARSQKEVRSSD